GFCRRRRACPAQCRSSRNCAGNARAGERAAVQPPGRGRPAVTPDRCPGADERLGCCGFLRPFAHMRRLLPLCCLLFAGLLQAQPSQPLTLDRIMADPSWIGPPVEQAWWSWDGREVYYPLRRGDTRIQDLYAQPVDGGQARLLDGAARGAIDGADPVLDPQRVRMAFVRSGDVFVRDLRSGALLQLTRSEAQEVDPRWGSDGSLVWRSGHDWFRWNAGDGVVVHAAAPKAEDDPGRPPKADRMREDQLRLVATLRREREQRGALRAQEEQWRRADPSRPPAPVYLGKDVEIVATALSPDGRWLFAVTERKQDERGQPGRMPVYLTESGYEDTEEVRTRVGRNLPRAQSFWIVDLQQGTPREVSTAQLPGIGEDPLAALRREAGAEPLKGPRAVRIEAGVRGLLWSADSQRLALMLHSVDNKDRWLAVLDPGSTTLHSRHRLHDPA